MAGPIINNFSYHWLFWFPLAAVVISTLLTLAFVPESPYTAPSRINWSAAALMSVGLTARAVRRQPGVELGLGLAEDDRAARVRALRDGSLGPPRDPARRSRSST